MMIFLNCKLILWPLSLIDQAILSLKTFETENETLYFRFYFHPLSHLILLHVLKLNKVQIKPVFFNLINCQSYLQCAHYHSVKWKWRCHLLSVQLFVTPWTVALQAPLSMEFSRQEYYRIPFPSPGDLPHPGIKPRTSALQADSFPSEPPGKPLTIVYVLSNNTLLHTLKNV